MTAATYPRHGYFQPRRRIVDSSPFNAYLCLDEQWIGDEFQSRAANAGEDQENIASKEQEFPVRVTHR